MHTDMRPVLKSKGTEKNIHLYAVMQLKGLFQVTSSNSYSCSLPAAAGRLAPSLYSL